MADRPDPPRLEAPFCHSRKGSKSDNQKRAQVFKHQMQLRPRIRQLARQRRKISKANANYHQLPTHSCTQKDWPPGLMGKKTVFTGSPHAPKVFHRTLTDKLTFLSVHEHLNIVPLDFDDGPRSEHRGVKLLADNDNRFPVAVLVPSGRAKSTLMAPCKRRSLFEEMAKKCASNRGDEREALHETADSFYSCAGFKAFNGQVSGSSLKVLGKQANRQLAICLHQADQLIRQNLPGCLVHRFNHVCRDLFAYKTLEIKDGVHIMYPAMAGGLNVYHPDHKDEDSWYSVVIITAALAWYDNYRDPVAFFCFSGLGEAVPLRIGDALIFNSQHSHCLSSRVSDDAKFYAHSAFLSMGLLTGNSADEPLTRGQLEAWKEMAGNVQS